MPDDWPNLTVRKIPNHIRARCEWGHDDYSLNVANLPMAEASRRRTAQPACLTTEARREQRPPRECHCRPVEPARAAAQELSKSSIA